MYDKAEVQDAIKNSLQTEKNAMDFYRLAASHMRDQEAKKTFELLSKEERSHARWFYKIYMGSDIPDFNAFMSAPPARESDWLSDLEKLMVAELDERKALKLAMDKELRLEKHLREKAAKIEDPDIRKVYEINAKSTHNHYLRIESEYTRLMRIVHDTDIDTFVRE